MACLCVFAPPTAMAATQLARTLRYEDSTSWPTDGNLEVSPLRLSWVVVTDASGNRRLRMQWEPAQNSC